MEVVAIGRMELVFAVLLSAALAGCGSTNAEKAPASTTAPSVRPQDAEIRKPTAPAPVEIQQTAHVVPPPAETVKVPAGPAPTPAELVAKSEAFYARTPSYTCRITRQERLGNRLQPIEKMILHFRSKPRSVYYRWVGDACAGRECVWVENAHDGKIVTKGGKHDFGMKGLRVAVAPDGFMAKSRSRYMITESGQDIQVKKLRELIDRCERGDLPPETLKYVGLDQPAGTSGPMHRVVETIQPNGALFPNGGVRDWHFDPETGRIVLVEAKDSSGERQEYYHFEHLFANNTLTAADFDPDIVFGRPKDAAESAGKGDPPK